ncbi:hypothetical protein J3E73DRAFT_430430 [Bipolaris maydis]|nr:hypothetical protein J3E73DRAFT_243055 [Bipolaris maydis]KAJ5028822.1 hypothetical protein J3E73DRAFT_430430 [Bipolaris maydis]
MDIDLEEEYSSYPIIRKSGGPTVINFENKLATQQTTGTPTQRTVTYRDVAVQTVPPSNAETFRKIYNREPTQKELFSDIGTAAIGRYTVGDASNPYETIIGTPVPAPVSLATGNTYSNASFQTLSVTDCKVSIVRAKAKASVLVVKQRHAAQAAGYKIWCEKKDELIVHAEQCPIRIRFDEDGKATNTDVDGVMLPNICGEEIDPTAALSGNESAVLWGSRTHPGDRANAYASTHHNRIPELEPSPEPTPPARNRWDTVPAPSIPMPKQYKAPEHTVTTHPLTYSQCMNQDLTKVQNTTLPMDIDPSFEVSGFNTYNRTNMDEVPSRTFSPRRTSKNENPHPSAPKHEHNRNRVFKQPKGNLTRATDTSFQDYVSRIRNDAAANAAARDMYQDLPSENETSAWNEGQDFDPYAHDRATEDVRRETAAQQRSSVSSPEFLFSVYDKYRPGKGAQN